MCAASVILQSRTNLFQKPGGDTVQIRELQNGLRKNGFQVRISTALRPNLASFDVVHLFNITRVNETYIQLINAKMQRKPVFCSTIYHPLTEYNRRGRFGLSKYVFRILRSDHSVEYLRGFYHMLRDWRQAKSVLRQWAVGYRRQQQLVLTAADRIIFGSESEKRTVLFGFGEIAAQINHAVVQIGIPSNLWKKSPFSFEERYGLKDFVLCVGRIEDLKNQLRLVEAMHGIPIPLVLVGSLNSAHRWYGKKVQNALKVRGNSHFMGHLDRELLASVYSAARVHALPSWFETTGLSSLEAGLFECNIVSTDRGYARDYLEGYAWYCDPSNPLSIKKAILAAYDSPVRKGLKEHIKGELTFQKMMDKLIKLYLEVM